VLDTAFHNSNNESIKQSIKMTPKPLPIWNHKKEPGYDSVSSNNNSNTEWQRLIYGDDYFDDNIAHVTTEWDDEDRGKKNKAKYCSVRTKQLMLMIAIGLFATTMATV
jgi:hypothetical protein